MEMKILVVSEIKYPKLRHLIKNVIQFKVLQYVYSSSFLAYINYSQLLLFRFLLNNVHHVLTTTDSSHHMTSLWAGQVWLTQIQASKGAFPLLQNTQTSSESHIISY